MAHLGYTFDANTVEPDAGLEVLPAGEYPVMIVDSSMDATKSGSGQYLKLQLQVLDGPHKGATLFDRLNLVNSNPKAQEIAQRQLSAICHAIGVLQVQDSAQLHHRPLMVRLAYRPAQGEYGASNDVKGYKPVGGPLPAPPAAQAPPQATQPAPWSPPPQPAAPPPAVSAPVAGGQPPWLAGKAAAA